MFYDYENKTAWKVSNIPDKYVIVYIFQVKILYQTFHTKSPLPCNTWAICGALLAVL